jgi:putative tryptophan/tyrosine transport system substrate-binding protein
MVLQSPLMSKPGQATLPNLAVRHRLPAIFASSRYAAAGGLISYGVKFDDLFRRATSYVDRILQGTQPGELPVEQPTNFELVVNLKTANQIGLTIPSSILYRADKVIR